MKLTICSVRDSKADAFLQPFFAQSRGVAIRSFSAAAKPAATAEASHDFAKYPDDFSLFELGTFDQVTGVIDIHDQPVNLGLASQLAGDSNS